MSSLEDLDVLAETLLKQAQRLPPGKDRNDALNDIGKLREKLDALKTKPQQDTTLQPDK